MLLLVACIDYGVSGGTKDSPTPPEPDIQLGESALSIDGVCADMATSVGVGNAGEADLHVSDLSVVGDGWQLGSIVLPATVAPGAQLDIPLLASSGRATLSIRSDDPDEGVAEVALEATANLGPAVFITSPGEDEIIDPGDDLLLSAVVSDAEDAADLLVAEWSSELTGPIGTTTPSADGLIELPWPASERANGPQVISVRVSDPCGNTGEQTIFFCQDGAWLVDTLAIDAWHTEADAVVDQGAATATLGPGVGAAFDAYSLFNAEAVDVSFYVRGAGAGFTFTALDSARAGTDWIGGDGCGLGYADCADGEALPGWSLVFDTLGGDGNDCDSTPSIGVSLDGSRGRQSCTTLPALDDGGWHAVTVHVLAPQVLVTLDGATVYDAEIAGLAPAVAWLGFTGVGDWELRNVEYTDYTCN